MPGWARRGSALAARGRAGARAAPSAGCRPRACRPGGRGRAADVEGLDPAERELALPSGPDPAQDPALGLERERDVLLHAELADDALGAPVLGRVDDAQRDRRPRGRRGSVAMPSIRMMPASSLSMPVRARASSVRPEPSRPATPSTSPSIRSTSASAIPEPTRDRPGAEEGSGLLVRDVQARRGCGAGSALAAEHLLDQVDAQQLPGEVLADQLAVAEHGDPVADLVDLVEEVRDEEDRDAALLELADHPEQLGAPRPGRGWTSARRARAPDVGRDRPGDRDQLLHGERVSSEDRAGSMSRPRSSSTAGRARASVASRSARADGAAREPSTMFSATERFGSRSISW